MGRMWWEDLNWERRRYRAWQAYGQSKLANQLFIRGLARRVPYDATLAHPGWSPVPTSNGTPWVLDWAI